MKLQTQNNKNTVLVVSYLGFRFMYSVGNEECLFCASFFKILAS